MSLGRLVLIAATLGVAITAVGAGIGAVQGNLAPLSLLWAAGAVASYVGLVLSGVLNPALAMFAPVTVRLAGAARAVALTFDDGPDPRTTPVVLETLARFGAHATFFVLGEKVRAAPEVLRAIAQAGHTIGIHGDSHDRFLSLRHPRRIVRELERARSAVAEVTGQVPRLFRPPVGHISPRTAAAAKTLGLTLVAWSVRSRDGLARTSVSEVEHRVCKQLQPGAIVLLHDAAEYGDREPAGVAALPAILAHAQRAGLVCVALEQP